MSGVKGVWCKRCLVKMCLLEKNVCWLSFPPSQVFIQILGLYRAPSCKGPDSIEV